MPENVNREIFLASKDYYLKIADVHCPILNNEIIHFPGRAVQVVIRQDGKGKKKILQHYVNEKSAEADLFKLALSFSADEEINLRKLYPFIVSFREINVKQNSFLLSEGASRSRRQIP